MHYPISPIQSNVFDTSSCIFNFCKFPKKKSETKKSKILATYWDPLGPTGPTFSMYSSASVHFWVTSGRRSSKDFFSRSSASACFTCCSAWMGTKNLEKNLDKSWDFSGESWRTQIIWWNLPSWKKLFVLFDFYILVLLCRAFLRIICRVWQCQRYADKKQQSFNDDHCKFPNFNGFFSSRTPAFVLAVRYLLTRPVRLPCVILAWDAHCWRRILLDICGYKTTRINQDNFHQIIRKCHTHWL